MRNLSTVAFLFTILLPLAVLYGFPEGQAGSWFTQEVKFNADSAYAYLEHLCVNIGPRPMGSVNERVALNWVVEKFRRMGADTAYVMLVPEARGTINTTSGVAIGVFRGASDSTIVIGGHIDSSGPDIPGANDDASGTACVIELARQWSQRPRRYTLLFAAFGGEESGLVGSTYFVDHYREINKVALMLQIDMAGSDEQIIPFFEVRTHQAPSWLVEDAYAIDRALGYNSLDYPTHFFSLNNAIDAAGSDHQPFLRKNIPAIDFTAGINTSPIHTAQDKIDFITKPMLARSGRLVEGLLTKYQAEGIPAPRKAHFMLWQGFGGRLFIPQWMIISINVLALVLGVITFFRSRKQRLQIEKSQRVRFSGLKLFLSMILIAIFAQLGEAAMQWLKGLRYAWMVAFIPYLWFAALWALAGVWVAVQLTRVWRFSPDPYVYAKRAIIYLLVYIILLGLVSARLALYPALTLLALSLAIFLPGPNLKILATIVAPLPMFRLMFMEALPLYARTIAENGAAIDKFVEAFAYSAGLTLILVLWYLPILYIFAYTLACVRPFREVLKPLRRPALGFVILLAIFGYGGYLYAFQAYNEKWHASLQANAEYNLRNGESKLRLAGNEYFRKVNVLADTLRRQYDARIHQDDLPLVFKADWMKLSGAGSVSPGQRDTIMVNWQLASARPWYRTTLKIEVDTLEISDVTSETKYRQRKKRLTFNWYAEPPETLRVAARFTIPPGAKLFREVTAVYREMPIPVKVTAALADVKYRTTVTYRDTLIFAAKRPSDIGQP